MAKTTFSDGIPVQQKWFNGAREILFDGLDEDWHYPPLTNDQVQISGVGGFDKTFVTLTGIPQTILSNKIFSGTVNFSGVAESQGSNSLWDAKITDPSTFLSSNPDTIATQKVVYEHGLVIDGGSID